MSRLWVIDTNVIVSGLIYPRSNPGRIITAGIAGHFDFAYDSRILAEYRDVLSRKKFGFNPETIDGFLSALLTFPATPAKKTGMVLPDPSDLPFAEVALSTPERILVTGNRRHFLGAEKLGLNVIDSNTALEVLHGATEQT